MTGLDVIDIARASLWVVIQIASPLLLIALIIGVVVSLLQALTQVQEFTLTFIPKIMAILLALFFLLPFYGDVFQRLTTRIFDQIVVIESEEAA